MTMDEDEAVSIAWQANIDRVQAAKLGVRRAIQNLADVEAKVARACARRRFPTPSELAMIDAAREVVHEAREEVEAARLNFKAGVPDEQVQSMIAEAAALEEM